MNELQFFGERVIVTSTGYAAQIANVGVIPFWLPFYVLGLLVNWLRGGVGSGLTSDYALWLDFGDWLYGLLACVVMYHWARTRFSAHVALAATLIVTTTADNGVGSLRAAMPLLLHDWPSLRRQRASCMRSL